MRYKDTGELHMDFHGATNTTINYVMDNYGIEALNEIFKSTAQHVYKQIHEKLKKGDSSELIDFWQHYYTREDGEFSIIQHKSGNIELTVTQCPAIKHLEKLGIKRTENACLQTTLLNKYLCEGTDYEFSCSKTGNASCQQRFTKKGTQI